MKKIKVLLLGLIVLNIGLVKAATYTVNNINDSGPGSLRQAIIDANASPGLDNITFNISGTGTHTILLSSQLPLINDPAVIDGYTQSGAIPATAGSPATLKIIIDGNGGAFSGLSIDGGCTVKGLSIVRFNNGISVWSTDGPNVISGNYIGILPDGITTQGNSNFGIDIYQNSDNNVIGGPAPADRNIISGNGMFGILFRENSSTCDNNIIQGNYIGTDQTGTIAKANISTGIHNAQARGTQYLDNVICSSMVGLEISKSGGILPYGLIIKRNRIGIGIHGEDLGNSYCGICILSSYNNLVGGSASDGNIIAYNGIGIEISGNDSYGNQVKGNSIFNNDALGIDLIVGSYGVNLNDTGDPDTGPNELQNFPRIDTAYITGSNLIISGLLNSLANTSFNLEFFNDPVLVSGSLDPSGYGEGYTLIHSMAVTTNGSGNATFNISIPSTGVYRGDYISATATNNATNSTSEFSGSKLVASETDSVCKAETNYIVEVTRHPDALAYDWQISPAGPVLTPFFSPTQAGVSINFTGGTPGVLYTLTVRVQNECGWSEPSMKYFYLFDCDFGDTPDVPYPTLLVNNGARHFIINGIYLGTVPPDAEINGQPSANAGSTGVNGDDGTGSPDDEDGVTFPGHLIPGLTQSITAAVHGAGGKLSAWIDWNQDGDWADANEKISNNVSDGGVGDADATVNGVIRLSLNVPAGTTTGTTFSRFRWSTKAGLGYTGEAPDGEVEDYLVAIKYPDLTPVITAIPNVMHGLTNFNLTIRVTELNSVNTNGLITVKIPKDRRWSLNGPFNKSLTIIGTIPVNNADWNYSEDANFCIFTTSVVIPAGSFSTFGFAAIFDPVNTMGIYTLTSQIDPYSGGENRINNNADAERIDYFIY